MLRQLKHLTNLTLIIFLSFFFLKLSTPIQAFDPEYIQALQSPGANLESFISGKLTPEGSSGLAPILGKYLIISSIGAYDENGELITAGAGNILGGFIANIYKSKPVSSSQYLAHISKKMPFSSSVYAVNTTTNDPDNGTDFLEPILKFWEVSRNIAYVFFVIIFVIIGFMIMLRSKLNPQTAITLQLALPKIIVSLILVTFSYAISGLIVDTAFIGNSLIYNFLQKAGTQPNIQSAEVDLLGFITGAGAWGSLNIFTVANDFLTQLKAAYASIGKASADLTVIFSLILAFTLLQTMIKIFFSIFTKYVTIILSAIFSPFVFLFGAIPGKSDPTSSYIKSMMSASLTFPATYLLFVLSSHFIKTAGTLPALRDLPPLNSLTPGGPTALGAFKDGLSLFVALGILMIIPSIPQAIDKALGTGSGIGAGAADFSGALRKIPLIGGLLG